MVGYNDKGRYRTVVLGTGIGLPRKVLTNFDLEKMVETNDEWIVQRTGIRERRIAAEDESTVTFGLEAARNALTRAGLAAEDLDMIIVGTATPDYIVPSAACLLQSHLGARNASAFDISAGCTGWIYGLVVADNFIRVNPYLKILVVGAEVLSRRVNWEDRTTCVLFGDGAGAVVVTGDDSGRGILSTCLQSNGDHWPSLTILGGGSIHPPDQALLDQGKQFIAMEGNKVYKLAVAAMEEVGWLVLTDAGYRPEDVDLLVPHQANIRIMEAVAARLGIPREKVAVTVDKYGNNSAATIPIALDEACRGNRLRENDLVLMVSFGGGFTWGGVLMRW